MEPIHWTVVYLALSSVVALVASKKGRHGWAFFAALVAAPVPLMLMTSYGLGNDMDKKPFAMWISAFLCPIIGLIIAVMSNNAQEVAIEKGEYGQYKKCPFCAESVRTEATKCRYCHSNFDKA